MAKKRQSAGACIDSSMLSTGNNDEFKPIGLSNLGNTCFFNSTLQALLATEPFMQKLGVPSTLIRVTDAELDYVKIDSICSEEKPDSESFCSKTSSSECSISRYIHHLSLMNTLRLFAIEVRKNYFMVTSCSSSSSLSSYSYSPRSFLNKTTSLVNCPTVCPKALFYAIASKWPIYRKLRQQDAHEFLRLFLGFLGDEEECFILKKRDKLKDESKEDDPPVVENSDVLNTALSNDKNTIDASSIADDSSKPSCGDKEILAPTLVNKVFAGLTLSTIRCLNCKQISTVKEPFLDISLDIVPSSTKKTMLFSSFSSEVALTSLLEKYFEVDQLNNNYIYDCEKCSRPSPEHEKSLQETVEDQDGIDKTPFSETESNGENNNHCNDKEEEAGNEEEKEEKVCDDDKNCVGSLSDSLSSISISSPTGSSAELLSHKKDRHATKPVPVFRRAEKWYRIEIFPEILVLHLKRFSSVSRGRFAKSSEKVSIPPTLDMSMFYKDPGVAANYELYALVIHIGSTMESGHYVSHVKIANDWYYCSDLNIQKIDSSKAMSPDAYILFYKRSNL